MQKYRTTVSFFILFIFLLWRELIFNINMQSTVDFLFLPDVTITAQRRRLSILLF